MGTINEDCPVFNNNDILYIKGSSIGSDISYFKGSSVDFGIIHQQDEQITHNPQKAFIIQQDESGIYLKTFVISYKEIENIVFPYKKEVMDYLRNFKNKHNQHDDSKDVNLNHYYELDLDEIDDGIDPVDNEVVEDLTKNYLEDVYFEGEKHPIIQKNINCKKCDAVYKTKKALKTHNERCHSSKTVKNSDKFPCDICSAVFGYKRSLYKHVKKCHSQVNCPPLPKEYWKKAIPFKSLLCDFCDKAFSSTYSKNKHLRDVHGENVSESLLCAHCGKAFFAKHNYNKHLKVVHGEDIHVPEKQSVEKCPLQKQFACEFCRFKFAKKHLLIDHARKIHGIDTDMVA